MTCTLMGPGVKQRGKSINICQESGFPVTKNYWLHFSRHLNSSRITVDSRGFFRQIRYFDFLVARHCFRVFNSWFFLVKQRMRFLRIQSMCKSRKSRIAVSSAIGLDTSGFLCVFFGATSEYPTTHLHVIE